MEFELHFSTLNDIESWGYTYIGTTESGLQTFYKQ